MKNKDRFGQAIRTEDGNIHCAACEKTLIYFEAYCKMDAEEAKNFFKKHLDYDCEFGPKKKKLVYLASPYSHPDPGVRNVRFQQVCKASAILMKKGWLVFSPIAHSHPIAREGGLPGDWAYWEEFDRKFISMSDEMMVLTLDGWENSVGIRAEVKIAEEYKIPMTHKSLEELEKS